MYPPLGKEHQVFGTDFCSGFVDKDGNWNNGFYCPQISPESSTTPIFCCGDSVLKYCCTGVLGNGSYPSTNLQNPIFVTETDLDLANKDYDISTPTPQSPPISGGEKDEPQTVDIARNSTIAAVICGLVAVTVLMTLVACFYCKCCLLYKKRRSQLPGGLYRLPASSTTCRINLLNSTIPNLSTPSNSNSASFNHSHHSAFVATAVHPIPLSIPALDPWGGAISSPVSTPTSQPLAQYSTPPFQGQVGPNLNYFSGPQLRSNVTNHNQNQTQLLNEVLRPRTRTPPGNLAFAPQSRTPTSPENSSSISISSVSTISSNPGPGPVRSGPHQTGGCGGATISRTNSNPSTTNAAAAIALRLQRQLLQSHYRNPVQQAQLQNHGSNTNILRSHSQGGGTGRSQIPSQELNSYPRIRETQPHPQNQNPSRIYTVGSRSFYHPTTLSSFLSSVNFSPGLHRSSSGGGGNLPPPYFVEQYRIRNRVRVPRNLPGEGPQPPQQLPNLSGYNLPSYDDLEQEGVVSHPQQAPVRESHSNGRSQQHRNFQNSQQSRNQQHPPVNSLRRPNHLVPKRQENGGQSPCSTPTSPINPSSPLNDLSAPGRCARNKNTGSSTTTGDIFLSDSAQPGPSPSRGISRQITPLESSNVREDEYDPSDKILNTTPLSPSTRSDIKNNSERVYKTQEQEDVTASEDLDGDENADIAIQKTEGVTLTRSDSRNNGAENLTA